MVIRRIWKVSVCPKGIDKFGTGGGSCPRPVYVEDGR